MNPNPFLKIDFTDIVIPNPFFPKELAEKKRNSKVRKYQYALDIEKI